MANNNEIKIHISAENQEFVDKMKEVVDNIRGAGTAAGQSSGPIEGVSTKLAKMGAIATGLYSTIMMVGASIKNVIAPVYEYSSALEQNTIAFETFLGSAKLAKKYLGDLQKIAADTPFDLPGLTQAGKKLLAFGFSAKQSLSMLRTIGDTSAGLGMGTAGIDRITLAIGQIKAKGKVMGDELLQLTEAGIPAYTILAQKLGLTAAQINNIGNANIDADTAINALLEGMNEKFGGLSSKIADTKEGMLSTIKDNAMAISEFLMRPLDASLSDGLKKIRDWTDDIADAIRNGDTSGAMKALFPDDLIPEDLREKLADIYSDIKTLFTDAKNFADEFGGTGVNAVSGIANALLDAVDNTIKFTSAILRAGTELGKIIDNIIPNGVKNFISMKAIIEVTVKALLGFFILNKVIKLAITLKSEYMKLQVAILATSKTSWTFLTNLATGLATATKGTKGLKAAIKAIGIELGKLNKKNIFLFVASIGLAMFGDKIMEWVDKLTGNGDLEDDIPINSSNEEEEQAPAPEDYPDTNGNNTSTDDEKDSKYYQAQQKVLKQETERINQYYSSLIGKLQSELNNLNDNYDANGNIAEQAEKIAQLEYNIAEAKYAQAQQIQSAISSTDFEDSVDKELEVGKVNVDLEELSRSLNQAADSLKNVSSIGKNAANALSNFGDVAVQGAENRLGIAYGDKNIEPDKLVCTQLVIESWKDAGLDFAYSASEWVPTLIDQAKAKGLWREGSSDYIPRKGDAIVVNGDSHVGMADGNGGIYHASYSRQRVVHDLDANAAFGSPTGYIAVADTTGVGNAGDVNSKSLVSNIKKYQQDFKKLLDDGNRVMEELSATIGDVSTAQIKKTITDYDAKIKKFNANGLSDFSKAAQSLKEFKISELDYKQIEKNMTTAYDDAERAQKKSLDSIASENISVLDIANKSANNYLENIEQERKKLENLLKLAKDNGWKDFANNISDLLDKINDNIEKFYQNSLNKLNEDLQRRLALIESDSNLTTLQKKDLTDEAKRDYYRQAIEAKEKERGKLLNSEIINKDRISQYDYEIKELQNQLEGLGSTLDKVHQASKQAFEDGLLDFLTRGILECESLGDAIRNLAISILQSIQKVYAEAATKNIMNALGLGTSSTASGGSSFSFTSGYGIDYGGGRATGGSLSNDGEISGPGTGTSDSIFMWADNFKKMFRVSDAEWVIKEKAAKYYGPNILSALNRGLIPKSIFTAHAKFASGGSLRGTIPTTSMQGAYGLTSDLTGAFSPYFNITNRIDGNGILNALGTTIHSHVDQRIDKNMTEKAKLHSMIMKRMK